MIEISFAAIVPIAVHQQNVLPELLFHEMAIRSGPAIDSRVDLNNLTLCRAELGQISFEPCGRITALMMGQMLSTVPDLQGQGA